METVTYRVDRPIARITLDARYTAVRERGDPFGDAGASTFKG